MPWALLRTHFLRAAAAHETDTHTRLPAAQVAADMLSRSRLRKKTASPCLAWTRRTLQRSIR